MGITLALSCKKDPAELNRHLTGRILYSDPNERKATDRADTVRVGLDVELHRPGVERRVHRGNGPWLGAKDTGSNLIQDALGQTEGLSLKFHALESLNCLMEGASDQGRRPDEQDQRG